MTGPRFPLVLIPRLSTYVGAGAFLTLPLDVSAFESATVHFWSSQLIGTAPTVTAVYEESTDLEEWKPCENGGPFNPAAETETTLQFTFKKRFMRLKVDLSGTDPGGTFYAIGHCDARERTHESAKIG